MNLSIGQAASQQRGDIKTSGAGGTLGGAANAGPAHPLTVGSVGFASNWPHELANEVMDQMAESIVDLAHKLEESEARVAVLEEEQLILKRKFAGVIEGGQRHCDSEAYATPSDLSPRTTLETVAFLRKFNLWRRGGYDQQPPRAHEVGEMIDSACDHIERMEREIEGLRDTLCSYKCRDKAAADGGWANK